MSKEYNLYANLVKVEKGNREDLLTALASLSDFDCDLNEILWLRIRGNQ